MKILQALQKVITFTTLLPLAAFANPSNSSDLVARGEHGGSHREGHHEREHHHEEGNHEGEHHHEEGDHEEARRTEEGLHENFNHNDFHRNFNDYHNGGGTYINGNVEGNPVNPIIEPSPIYVVPPSNQGN